MPKAKKRNKIIVSKKTGEVKSTVPPVDNGSSVVHEPTNPEDIVIVDHFKSADKLGPCHELEFENGRLRSKLVLWHDFLQIEGGVYKIQVDPLGQKLTVVDQ